MCVCVYIYMCEIDDSTISDKLDDNTRGNDIFKRLNIYLINILQVHTLMYNTFLKRRFSFSFVLYASIALIGVSCVWSIDSIELF